MKTPPRFALIAVIAALLDPVSAASSLPEYSATEAGKHIGETARLAGMVDCIGHGRRHTDVQIGGCLPHTLLWVVVPDDVSGPELDCGQLRGVTIAITGKIESPGGIPQVVVKSTEQIVPQTSPNPNYLASANDKENKGDLDGAIADLDRAVELTNDPGTYIERAGAKEKKADFAGAIRDYDELIERSADTNAFTREEYYQTRAKLKIKKSEFDGAIADADSAIRLYPRSPWHYATRGQANEAKGNFVAAVNDYQMAIKTEPHNSIYKDMLKHAQAQAAGSRGGNSQPGGSPQSATALVTQAKAKLAAGDFDGAIADCDRALQLSRGGSKEASGLRIQAMRAKGSSKSASAQPVNPGRSPEEQPITPTTKSGAAVAAGEARPKATSALLVDPTSGQPIGRETYNGSVKVEYSDGRSEIFCKDGNCTDPHVSHEGHVGWTHYTHRGPRNAAMNERLVIRFSNGQTKEFKPNPNGGPFIEEWNFIDNDMAVAIKSRGYHGSASFVRYDLISGRMTGHQDGYVEYEKMPEWAQPFSDDKPFGLPAPRTEPGPAAKGRDGDHASLPPAAQQTERVTRTTEATSPQSPPAGTNILGSPAEPGIADVRALVEFTGNGSTNKGRLPNGLIFASDGDIYGTTERGGANDYGTIFKTTTAGALTTLVEFAGKAPANSSGIPRAGLVEGRDGDFYGTTSGGGINARGENNLDNGTVFKLSSSGVLTTLVRFSCNGAINKGCEPYSGLVQAPNGDFYGTTFSGGSVAAMPIHFPIAIPGFQGFGTIYKMAPAGQLTTLYDFCVHLGKGQGGSPWSGLTLGRDGNFYGTTWSGLGVAGTIFKLTPTGAMTTLVRFGLKPPYKKGGGCEVELLQASDGNFYGTSPTGSPGGGGTVFKMTPSGAFTNLVEFANNDSRGVGPYAPLSEGNDGNLYGTTTAGGAFNCGTIFRVTPNGSFKVLWNFNNPNKLQQCEHPATGPLVKDKEGNFYGTTKWGGRTDWGTVFKLTLHNSGTQSSAVPTSNSSATASTSDASAAMKIVSQKEQTSKMGSSQSGEQTSEDLVPAASIVGKPSEKLFSPDKRYSVEVLRNSEDGLLVRQSGKTLTKISTQVGPVDSRFEALWSSDGRYVAINKQRSSRTGGDEMWIVSLPSGKVLRQPDDDLWDELDKRESAYIDEKHLSETGGKVFLTLTATGWGKGGLRFRLEAWFGEMELSYFFDGTVDPLNLKTINDWKVLRKQAEAASPQTPLGRIVSSGASAEVVDIPAAHSERGIKAGDIKITFSDGHTEVVTKNENCMEPKVSPTGHVGWTQCSGFDRKGYALNQKLIIHLCNGVTTQFKPNPNAPFIVVWAFADNDSAVVIQSMSFHGPSSYCRYELATGKMTNKKDGRNDDEPLPSWATVLVDR